MKTLLKPLKNDNLNLDKMPIWFMRQAGRYLPEYMKVRQKFDTFMDLCFSPQEAATITVQPLQRFDLDAAILFSDILVIPHALGQKVEFHKPMGPVLADFKLSKLCYDPKKLDPVFETIELVKTQLDPSKALIGFCGAPWTVATYMIEQGSSKKFETIKTYAYQHQEEFLQLLNILVESSTDYLLNQIKAGVDVIKIFDSWAGIVPAEHFDDWVIKPTSQIVENIKKIYPEIPIMGFPKGAGVSYKDYLQTKVDIVTIDVNLCRNWAKTNLSSVVLQGGLDPVLVAAGGKLLDYHIDNLLETFHDVPYIFNLGHGFIPQTPIANVEHVIKRVRNFA